MTAFTESTVEEAALAWLDGLGYAVRFGPAIAPGEAAAERHDYGQVVLAGRLHDALARFNPGVPADALDEAYRKLTRPDRPTLTANNHAAHRMIVEGVPVEYFRPGFGHLAFSVADVAAAAVAVLAAGGRPVGEIVAVAVAGGGRVTWCYVTDPVGNVIELQSWAVGTPEK